MHFRNLLKIAAPLLLLIASSCIKSNNEDPAALSRNSVNVRQNPNPYYYQPPQSGYRPYVQSAAPPAQPYYQPPAYQAPQPYSPYGGPAASRFYSNPYAIPPSTKYQRYDADQYYVPPTRYNNVESPTTWSGSSGR